MRITEVETEDREAQAAIFRGLDAYNDQASGWAEPGRELTVPLLGPDGTIAGGLFGYTYYDWLHLQLLVVSPALRGRGLGTGAVRAAEAEAHARGCRSAWAEADPSTGSFLAHLGWQVFAHLNDGPACSHVLFLRHDLPPSAGAGATPRADANALKTTLPPPSHTPLGLLLLDAHGAIEGGLWGWSERGRFFVQLLFVPERLRHRRLGTRLMARAAAVAERRGCRTIWLDTFSFQARPFYERLGFACFGTLPEYPPGGARYFLVKRLQL